VASAKAQELGSTRLSADQSPGLRESITVEIASNARECSAYKASLDEFGRIELPHGAVTEMIYGLDAERGEKIVTKEGRPEGGGFHGDDARPAR